MAVAALGTDCLVDPSLVRLAQLGELATKEIGRCQVEVVAGLDRQQRHLGATHRLERRRRLIGITSGTSRRDDWAIEAVPVNMLVRALSGGDG
jgi:hypothetical protein